MIARVLKAAEGGISQDSPPVPGYDGHRGQLDKSGSIHFGLNPEVEAAGSNPRPQQGGFGAKPTPVRLPGLGLLQESRAGSGQLAGFSRRDLAELPSPSRLSPPKTASRARLTSTTSRGEEGVAARSHCDRVAQMRGPSTRPVRCPPFSSRTAQNGRESLKRSTIQRVRRGWPRTPSVQDEPLCRARVRRLGGTAPRHSFISATRTQR